MSGSPHSNERRVLTRRPVAKWLLGRLDHASSGKDSHPSAGQPFGYKTELKGPFEKARARQVLRTVVTRGPFRKHSDLNKVETTRLYRIAAARLTVPVSVGLGLCLDCSPRRLSNGA